VFEDSISIVVIWDVEVDIDVDTNVLVVVGLTVVLTVFAVVVASVLEFVGAADTLTVFADVVDVVDLVTLAVLWSVIVKVVFDVEADICVGIAVGRISTLSAISALDGVELVRSSSIV
jgi:hypothetical protein